MSRQNKLKVVTVVSKTEIIRMSKEWSLINFWYIFIHTGQNYDFELNEIFNELEVRKPDFFLKVANKI